MPWHWRLLLTRGAKVSSYVDAGIGFCSGGPRYDLTLGLELAVAVGRQTMILPWQRHCLLARGAKWHDLSLALQLAAGLGRQGMIWLRRQGSSLPWHWTELLARSAKV